MVGFTLTRRRRARSVAAPVPELAQEEAGEFGAQMPPPVPPKGTQKGREVKGVESGSAGKGLPNSVSAVHLPFPTSRSASSASSSSEPCKAVPLPSKFNPSPSPRHDPDDEPDSPELEVLRPSSPCTTTTLRAALTSPSSASLLSLSDAGSTFSSTPFVASSSPSPKSLFRRHRTPSQLALRESKRAAKAAQKEREKQVEMELSRMNELVRTVRERRMRGEASEEERTWLAGWEMSRVNRGLGELGL